MAFHKNYNQYLRIIITMHNRNFLSRIIPYYQVFKEKYNIDVIIADSSEKPSNFDFGNIEYKYYGPKKNFFKLRAEVYKTKTKYLMLFGDDDFLVPESCIKCLDFLIDNPNYTVCYGRTITFKDQINPEITNRYQFKNYENLKNKPYINDRLKRIDLLFDNFFMLNNSIIKTDVYKKSRILDFSKSFFAYKYSDFTRAHFYLFEGDFKIIPHIFMLRSNTRTIHNNNLKKKMDINIEKDLSDYLNDTLSSPNPIIQYLTKKYGYNKNDISFFHGYIYGKYLQQRLSGELWKIPNDQIEKEKTLLLKNLDIKKILGLVDNYHSNNENLKEKSQNNYNNINSKFNKSKKKKIFKSLIIKILRKLKDFFN